MAWEQIKITVNGEEFIGSKNGNEIEMPFMEDISTESAISIDGNPIHVTMVTNVADRNETLKLEIKADDSKQVQRRTRSKSKSEDV
jgi:hypothetical protein